ncbi:D-arabinono-1,4-lactone oxidase [Pseudonocardia humida]|uniref:D-arabinono-1,4-lactone oxidase n=1 Tax=Pseudonocardia humida TaxID=2800819 RepID=UPI0027E2DEF3|nr:D-arabinono-1,4-lactone oxidase [Pseudonocardia humida]
MRHPPRGRSARPSASSTTPPRSTSSSASSGSCGRAEAGGAPISGTPVDPSTPSISDTDCWPYPRDFAAVLDGSDAGAHWRKIHFLARDSGREAYPQRESFVSVRRELDPGGVFLNDGLRRLVG